MTKAEALRFLGLRNSANTEEVTTAYKQLAKILHPDRFSNDEELCARATEHFKCLQEAYEVLKDTQRDYRTKDAEHQPEEKKKSHSSSWTSQNEQKTSPDTIKEEHENPDICTSSPRRDSSECECNDEYSDSVYPHHSQERESNRSLVTSAAIMTALLIPVLMYELSYSLTIPALTISCGVGALCSYVALYIGRYVPGFFDTTKTVGTIGTISATVCFSLFFARKDTLVDWLYILLGYPFIFALYFTIVALLVGIGWRLARMDAFL